LHGLNCLDSFIVVSSRLRDYWGSHDDVIKLLREKIISNIFSVRGHRTLKPRSKVISKNLIFFNSKLNGRKLEFNTPLNTAPGAKKNKAKIVVRHRREASIKW